jgi:hypothetical protein
MRLWTKLWVAVKTKRAQKKPSPFDEPSRKNVVASLKTLQNLKRKSPVSTKNVHHLPQNSARLKVK